MPYDQDGKFEPDERFISTIRPARKWHPVDAAKYLCECAKCHAVILAGQRAFFNGEVMRCRKCVSWRK